MPPRSPRQRVERSRRGRPTPHCRLGFRLIPKVGRDLKLSPEAAVTRTQHPAGEIKGSANGPANGTHAYTITGSNSGGTISTSVSITVLNQASSGLNYGGLKNPYYKLVKGVPLSLQKP